MNQYYGLSQEAAVKAQQIYGAAQATAQGQKIYNIATDTVTDRPPQPTRFSSCAGRLESQVNHLFACIERASRVADRLGGAIPQDPSKVQETGHGGCIASIIEEQNERFDTALKTFMHTLERLEQL